MNDYEMKVPMECPFCGKIPHYNPKTELVHCMTLDCALGDFFIHIDEWNTRYNNVKDGE